MQTDPNLNPVLLRANPTFHPSQAMQELQSQRMKQAYELTKSFTEFQKPVALETPTY